MGGDDLTALRAASLPEQGSRLKRRSYSGFVAARAAGQPPNNDYFATDPTL